jgi:hypothetical protein
VERRVFRVGEDEIRAVLGRQRRQAVFQVGHAHRANDVADEQDRGHPLTAPSVNVRRMPLRMSSR